MKAVNLIPSEQRSGRTVAARSGGAAYIVLGLLGGFVVLALLYGLSHHQLETRRAEAATLSVRAQQVEAQAAQLAPYAAFMSTREQRLQSIAQLIGGRFDWSNAMGELSRVLPSKVALTSLQGTVGARQHGGRARGDGRRQLGDAARRDADHHALGLRRQPDGGRADARALAPDRRRQQRRAAELHEGQHRRWRLERWLVPRRLPGLQRPAQLPAAADADRAEHGGVDLGGVREWQAVHLHNS